MPHADTSLVPQDITTKSTFYLHVADQLKSLLADQRNWVSNLSNAASLLYHSFMAFPSYFGSGERMVNWAGFYLDSSLMPSSETQGRLLLAPFSGKPACQFIRLQPGRGVCADAFVSQKTIVVRDVDAYPGHIACDGETKSEIVVPLMYHGRALGVLDLDCLAQAAFSEEDRLGLENVAQIIVDACDWE